MNTLNSRLYYIITKLLLVAGKNVILVIYNRLFKMIYFITIIKETLVEGLAQLFEDNIQKLYKLPESVVSDRELQFVAKLTKDLYSMLGIETKLLTAFHLQTDNQIERMNQNLEQYLKFFINHKQKNQPEQLALVEFAVNNKAHSTIKVSPFITNYGKELRIGVLQQLLSTKLNRNIVSKSLSRILLWEL